MKATYEVCVIGSGPSGQRAAIQAAKKGKKTVVIDRRDYKLGGVSLHTGTVPSKTLREAVLYLKGMQRKKVYGKSHRFDERIDYQDLMERVELIMAYELKIIESQFKKNDIDVVYGQAKFAGAHHVTVKNRKGEMVAEIEAEQFVVATGTVPRHPDHIIFDYKTIFDSNFIFSSKSQIKHLPESLIVYGAGVIGSEYALMFAALGCKVHLMDSHQELFPHLDQTLVNILKEEMRSLGVTLKMGKEYERIYTTPENRGRIVTTDNEIFEADAILFSKGRIPCVEPLGLEEIGVKLTDRKIVIVNEEYQTSVENIYACGDVIGYPALASTSAEQGRLAARYMIGLQVRSKTEDLFPMAIYTIPEMSSIGKTEEALKKEGINYEVGISYFYEVAKAAIAGNDTGALKLLFDPETLKIFGIHIIGNQAAEIVHIGQMVMAFGGNLYSFINNVFNYPTWAEAYKVAALNGINKLKN